MNINIKSLFGNKKKEERSMNSCICDYGQGSLLFGGLNNNYSALNISTVFRCVSLISQTIATIPIDILDKDRKELKNHPLYYYFNNKNDNAITRFDAFKQIIHNVLLQGNGYFYIERSNDGTPVNLRYIQANDMTINYKKELNKVFYQCSYINHGSAIPSKDVCHFKLYSYDGVNGISVLNYATRSIDVANRVENTAKQYYQNNGLISGVLSYNGNLSQIQKEQIRNDWQATYSNGNSGVCVIGGGMTYQPLSSNAADTQINESRNYSVADICRFFGVNQILLGLNNGGTVGSIEAIQTEFLVHTILPIIVMMENEMNKKLMVESDNIIDFNEGSMLRSDKSAQASYYSTLINTGILTRNEARTELGYNKVEGGDDLIIAFTKIEDNKINNTNDNN